MIKGIGKVAGIAAPFASLIPGVGPLAGAAIGAGGKLLSGGGAKGAVTGGLEGAAGGLAQKSGLVNKLGTSLGNTFAPGGNIDFAKVLGAAGGVADMIGRGQQRKSATDYANAGISQRNALMSKILGPQNYGVPNMNAQSSATPGIGGGGTTGY